MVIISKKSCAVDIKHYYFFAPSSLQKYCNTFSMATVMQFFCIFLDGWSFFDVFLLSFGWEKEIVR